MSVEGCEKKILTVTVPAYNAEGFLRDCLDSLCLPEVLRDLEVLVINDGSADDTAQIAQEYERRFPGTVHLISKENGGHGSGINCGIANATGIYFKVVDADDWVERDGFLKLIGLLKKLASERTEDSGGLLPDIVGSNFYWVYEKPGLSKEEFERETEYAEPFSGVQYEKIYRFDDIAGRLYIKMHNMTIRTEILQRMAPVLRVDEHCFYVDTEYVTYPIPFVETICFLKEYVYNYRIGRQGQSVGMERMRRNERDYDRVLDSLFAFYDRLAFGKTGDFLCSEEKKAYISNMIARVVAAKIKIMLSFPASVEKKRELAAFDRKLKAQYPEIYRSNINGAVKALRASGYLLYRPAAWMVKKKYSD